MKKMKVSVIVLLVIVMIAGCAAPAANIQSSISPISATPTVEQTPTPSPSPTPSATPSPSPEPTATPKSPIKTVYDYVLNNGVKPTALVYSQMDALVISKNVNGLGYSLGINKVSEKGIFFDDSINLNGTETRMTVFINEDQTEYSWMFNQLGNSNISGSGKVNPQNYELTVETVNKTEKENLHYLALTSLKVMLGGIDGLLSDLHYSVLDFGFSPAIATLKIDAPKAKPIPLRIKINKVRINSAGTPEAYVQFTNTGKKNIIAFDFYVKCYDVYGDVVKGYGHYDYASCTYDDKALAPGKITSSDWYWDLFGFDNTKKIEVAINKYMVKGEAAVEIPDSDLVWVKMK